MTTTPTGRRITRPRPLPFPYKGTLEQYVIQNREAETYARIEADLNEIEDRCIRMFGGDVQYLHDERIIHHG